MKPLNKKQFIIPLFWKFVLAITGTVTLFGIINLYFINYAVYDLFESELTRHGKITATSIAERGIVPISYDDLATLDRIVTDQKKIDSTIAYLFILDEDKNILAHTFEHNVPLQLINVNNPGSGDGLNTVKIQNAAYPGKIIRDMAIPILEGNLGTVRIGLYEENYLTSINKTTKVFMFMIAFFLCIGIIGAFFFSYIITTPLKSMSSIARKIELGTLDIQEEDFDKTLNRSELVKWKNILNVKDEIDGLISSFGEMVSRLKNTYAELQKTQDSLFQSEKMSALGTLSAGLAHEINNPIAGMQNCLRRLKGAPENLKQNLSYLDMIDEALLKIEQVVKGLLDFSKKPELQFQEVNLNNIVENVLILTSYKLESSQIAIRKNYDHKPNTITASANHLEQVLLNLVLNSIDAIEEKKTHNPAYSGEIQFNINENGHFIELEISDNGTGVPVQHLKDIFDPFFTLSKVKHGTGLGLSVSYSIVEQHNGAINAILNNSGGLSIFLSFPKT